MPICSDAQLPQHSFWALRVGVEGESCKIMFLGGHFLFTCSDMFVEGCNHLATMQVTDRHTEDRLTTVPFHCVQYKRLKRNIINWKSLPFKSLQKCPQKLWYLTANCFICAVRQLGSFTRPSRRLNARLLSLCVFNIKGLNPLVTIIHNNRT